ncbi:hypothetical protein vBAspATola_66 [Aeromonas phage vB_AspA_Tola]|nr:hypothetical protein vBAspATola_66 [Aeromonas phage vB_AspA_Tola]
MNPSEWCNKKHEEAMAAGNMSAAYDYFQLTEMWRSRNL